MSTVFRLDFNLAMDITPVVLVANERGKQKYELSTRVFEFEFAKIALIFLSLCSKFFKLVTARISVKYSRLKVTQEEVLGEFSK